MPQPELIETAEARGRREARRVCIITPGAIGSNPRVVKEADALQDAGWRVMVVSTRTLAGVEPRDAALLRRVRWDSERVDLTSRPVWRRRRIAQLAARTAYAATGIEGLTGAAFSAFSSALYPATLRSPADLYIAHYPAALPVAAAAARRHGARYAYDAEDYHLGDWPETPAFETERRLVRAIEGRHLPGCAYVTAASPAIADAYAVAYAIARPHVVLNVFPLDQAPDAPTRKGSAAPGPSLYWFSQTIGPDRGLECAVRAIAASAARPHFYVRGSMARGYEEGLMGMAASLGVADLVHVLAPVAPDDMERLAAEYDLGLVAETGATAARGACLTNKLFSFLLAGVPVLMSDTPAHRAFAAEAGLDDQLYPIDDSQALAGVIDRLLEAPARLAAARERAWALGRRRYNWDQERQKVIALAGGGARAIAEP